MATAKFNAFIAAGADNKLEVDAAATTVRRSVALPHHLPPRLPPRTCCPRRARAVRARRSRRARCRR
jgi:hypothetical protein